MDIKTSQATQTANSAAGSPDQQPFWSYLTVRTMKQDLAALGPKAPAAALAPAAKAPVMARPSLPQVSRAAETEKKKEKKAVGLLAKQKIVGNYDAAKSLMAAKKFDEAIAKLRQIAADPQAGWWLKWKASRLLKKVQKLLITPVAKKEEKKGVLAVSGIPPLPRPVISSLVGQVASAVPAAPVFQPPKVAVPPPSLPIGKPVPVPEIKVEEKIIPSVFPPSPPQPAPSVIPSVTPPPPIPKPPAAAAPAPRPAVPKPAPAVMSEWVASLGQPPAGPPKSELAWKKIILIGAILVAVFFSVGLWFIWPKGGQPTSPSPSISVLPSASLSPSPSPSELPPALPAVLFKIDKKAVIELAATEDNLAGQKLAQQFSQSSEPAGSFTQIIFQTNQALASFDRVISMLNLDFLNSLVSLASTTASYKVSTSTSNDQTDLEQNPFSPNLPKCGAGEKCRDDVSPFKDFYLKSDQSFSLFVYTQAPLSASPFSGSQNEGRLGLIAKFKDSADLAGAIKDLKNSEPSLLKSAGALFLGKNINLSAADSFSDNDYLGIAIRYVNLAGPELSFDYAIVKNTLLIATSKESMYAAINRLQERSKTTSGYETEGQTELKPSEAIVDCGEAGPDKSVLDNNEVMNCLETNFKACKPAKYTSSIDMGSLGGLMTYYYEIIGLVNNLCAVKSKFLKNPNPVWVGKEMTCQYDKVMSTHIWRFSFPAIKLGTCVSICQKQSKKNG